MNIKTENIFTQIMIEAKKIIDCEVNKKNGIVIIYYYLNNGGIADNKIVIEKKINTK